VFPVRYELNIYILFRRNSALKGLTQSVIKFFKALSDLNSKDKYISALRTSSG
jgi:hypothetical protein